MFVYLELRNINPHKVTHSIIYRNPRERIFVVQISLLIVIFLSLISRNLSLMQTTKVVNPHPRITPCVNIRVSPSYSYSYFLLRLLLLPFVECWCMRPSHHPRRPSGVDYTSIGDRRTNSKCPHISFVLFHNITHYTNSLIITHPC